MWFEVLVPDVSMSEGVIDGERKKKKERCTETGRDTLGSSVL